MERLVENISKMCTDPEFKTNFGLYLLRIRHTGIMSSIREQVRSGTDIVKSFISIIDGWTDKIDVLILDTFDLNEKWKVSQLILSNCFERF